MIYLADIDIFHRMAKNSDLMVALNEKVKRSLVFNYWGPMTSTSKGMAIHPMVAMTFNKNNKTKSRGGAIYWSTAVD